MKVKDKDVVDKIVERYPPCEDNEGSGDFVIDESMAGDACQGKATKQATKLPIML